MSASAAARIARLLAEHDDIVIAAHVNPDGDAVGATAAMGYVLAAMGKRFALYNGSGFPPHLAWLTLPGRLYEDLRRLPFKPKLFVCLDSGDMHRLGEALVAMLPRYASISIDHHLGNTLFASLDNWVEPAMASTGQMVAHIADAAGVELCGPLAEALYLSLVTDTGSFSHGNTSPEVFDLAARLMRGGLDAAALRARMDSQWSLAKLHLLGLLFAQVRLEDAGRVAVSIATEKTFSTAKALASDTEGYVEQLRSIAGVRVALFVREEGKKRIKASLRSRGADDVRAIAARFGGGGHKNAAGVVLAMGIDEAMPKLLAAIHELFEE